MTRPFDGRSALRHFARLANERSRELAPHSGQAPAWAIQEIVAARTRPSCRNAGGAVRVRGSVRRSPHRTPCRQRGCGSRAPPPTTGPCGVPRVGGRRAAIGAGADRVRAHSPRAPPRARTRRQGRCCGGTVASRRAVARGSPAPRGADRGRRRRPGRSVGAGAGRHPAPGRVRRPGGRRPRTRRRRAASARVRRAACNGSSGAGNGMRSITTSTHAAPAASMPAQNERVPTSTDASSSTKASMSRPGSRSPCSRMSWSVRSRSKSANRLTFACDVHSTSARPPAAFDELADARTLLGPLVARPARVGKVLGDVEDPLAAPVERRRGLQRDVAAPGIRRPAAVVVAVAPRARRGVRLQSHLDRERGERRRAAERRGNGDHRDAARAGTSRSSPPPLPARCASASCARCARPTRRRRCSAPRARRSTSSRPVASRATRFAYSLPRRCQLRARGRQPLAARHAARCRARRRRRTTHRALARLDDARDAPADLGQRLGGLRVGTGPQQHAAQARQRVAWSRRPRRRSVALSGKACASSMMTTSWSGRTRPSDARCEQYSAWLTTSTDTSCARSRASSAKHSDPVGALALPRTLCARTAHRRPRRAGLSSRSSSARSPVCDRSAKARRCSCWRPKFAPTGCSNSASGAAAARQLGAAHVVRPALQQRVREAEPAVLLQRGQVLAHELTLQRDRRGRDDDLEARTQPPGRGRRGSCPNRSALPPGDDGRSPSPPRRPRSGRAGRPAVRHRCPRPPCRATRADRCETPASVVELDVTP